MIPAFVGGVIVGALVTSGVAAALITRAIRQ